MPWPGGGRRNRLPSAAITTSAIRLEVSTLPPATAAGGRALTRHPGGALTSTGPISAGRGGDVRVGQHSQDVVDRRLRHRERAVEVPGALRGGAREVDREVVAGDAHRRPRSRAARRGRAGVVLEEVARRVACRRAWRRSQRGCAAPRSRGRRHAVQQRSSPCVRTARRRARPQGGWPPAGRAGRPGAGRAGASARSAARAVASRASPPRQRGVGGITTPSSSRVVDVAGMLPGVRPADVGVVGAGGREADVPAVRRTAARRP